MRVQVFGHKIVAKMVQRGTITRDDQHLKKTKENTIKTYWSL
jgi:hypothetical protein